MINFKNQKVRYFELIKELAVTDFKLKFQGSVLGYLWSLVKPLMLFAVLYVVFTQFLKIGGNIDHYAVYLLLGVVFWGFFSELTAGSLDSIVSRGDLIRKIYFPRIVLVLSRGITIFITFMLNLFAVFLFIIFTGVDIDLKILFLPLIIIELFILSLGVGLFLSSFFVKYRDIAHIWEIVLQALFYATPILYPLSLVPSPYNKILLLNPVAQVIQDARYVMVTDQTTTAWNSLPLRFIWIPYVLPFIALIFGLIVFNKSAAKFAEEV